MMNKSVLITIVVLAILLAAGFWWKANAPTAKTSSIPDTASTESANLEEVIVDYTDAGYDPDRLRVPLGTSVTWRNESSKPMWTASDPHPMHTIYPEFDAKVGVEPGGSYSFTFT